MINYIELVINSLLRDLILTGENTKIHLRHTMAAGGGLSTTINNNAFSSQGSQTENGDMCDDIEVFNMAAATTTTTTTDVVTTTPRRIVDKQLMYGNLATRHRFALIVYLLGQTHDLLIKQNCCTYRELLYRNVHFPCDTGQITRGVKDVCRMLGQTSWNLGIFSSGKGMITGPLLILMSNGDVIDCSSLSTPTLIPPNFTYIDHFVTTAEIILLVEKDTVFKKLLFHNIFSAMDGKVLLVTAKGYPDVSTRWLLNKIVREYKLPLYMIADGDPFGIEIMLTYRHGSQAMLKNVNELACPSLKWLGIHPSDITSMNMEREALAAFDYRKIDALLKRPNVCDEIKKELIILRQHQSKVKIDNLSADSYGLFINDYIINKIKRCIVL